MNQKVSNKSLKLLIETERVADQIMQSKQEIVELDKRRQINREALRSIQNGNENKTWITIGPMLVKMKKEKAVELLSKGKNEIINEKLQFAAFFNSRSEDHRHRNK